MSHDGISSVYDLRVVATLVEHTHIQSQHICEINSAASTALIWADYHHMIAVDL